MQTKNMNENFQDFLADNSEVFIDSLIENEIIKEIPILGSSLKIIRGIQGLRDRAYLNKIKLFLEKIGEINGEQKKVIINDSKKNEKSRTKFGDAIFTTIEQSDSTVKVEYLAIAFEAYVNEEINESDLRLICHVINNTFSDELIDIIENEKPIGDLKNVVSSGLAETKYREMTFDGNSEPDYILSKTAEQLRIAWRKYCR